MARAYRSPRFSGLKVRRHVSDPDESESTRVNSLGVLGEQTLVALKIVASGNMDLGEGVVFRQVRVDLARSVGGPTSIFSSSVRLLKNCSA